MDTDTDDETSVMEEEAVPSPQVPLSDSQIITTTSTPVAPTPPHREPLVKSRPKITYVDKVSDISMAQGFLPEDKDSLHNTGIPQNYAVRHSGTSSKGRSLYLCPFGDQCSSPPYTSDITSMGSHVRRHHLGHCIQCPYNGNRFYNATGWWDHMSSKHKGAPWYRSQLGIDSQLPTTLFKATNPSSTVTAVKESAEITVPVLDPLVSDVPEIDTLEFVPDIEEELPDDPATTGKEPKTSKSGNSVQSGPNKNITDSINDGPFSNQTTDSSNAKSGPRMKHTSKKAPHRKYYKPSNDTKTFQINNKGHLQCLQDPNLIHKPNDKGKLPGSREAPIYHEPGRVSCKTVEDLKKLYPISFNRIGSLKGAYNIRVDATVKPATHARRKVPIQSKEAIDQELDYLIEEEIITEQVEPTPLVSSVTFPRKPNGEVRVCLDPSNLNKAIIREHHKPMTVEEIAHELAGVTVYTKAYALKAFLQIHLMHEASLLTTFNSHRGWLQFLWMPFGAKMNQDVFQLRMDAILKQCPGVIGIHDDMVIFGVDQQHHDANLINILNVCQKEGLVLNSKKLELRKERFTFFGAEYSAQGMHPDPKKVQGITEMTAPTDKQQLQSFLGMVNYMGTFIPNLSHHTEPLRAMLKKDNVFHWEEQQTRSFQQVKSLIAKANTTPLRYYDRNLPVTVQADASLRGLGACLIQQHKGKDQPIAFASKSLTDAETRYANIERELLAIVFACQCFSTYLLGRSFVAESDHKPLEMIAMKNLANVPPRLQRMLLELQRYDVTIKYRLGKEMQLADALSCCLARASQEIKLDMRVDYIAFMKPWTEKLKDSTQRDPILVTVYQLTQQGWLHQ